MSVTGERLTFLSWSPQPQQPRWDGSLQTSLDPGAEEETHDEITLLVHHLQQGRVRPLYYS